MFGLVGYALFGLVERGLVQFGCSGVFRFGMVIAEYCNSTKMENLGLDPISTQYLLRLRTVLPF